MSNKYDSLKRECTVCHAGFLKGKTESSNHFLKRVYCSHGCYWEALKGRKLAPFSDEHKKKIGDGNRGKIHSVEQNQRHSEILKGSIPWNKGKKGTQTLSLESRKRLSELNKGANSYLWKGGITPLVMQIRGCLEYRQWRTDVFVRDNYTCQDCGACNGNGKKIILNADHIKTFSTIFSENQISSLEEAVACSEFWDLDNGRTLCLDCHKIKTWGNKILNKKICQTTK